MNAGATNKTSRTDWDRLASMTDDEIDYSDIPPLTDDFFEHAELRMPAKQAQGRRLTRFLVDLEQTFCHAVRHLGSSSSGTE